MGRIRIYADESVDIAIAEGLKRRGVDAFSARDAGNLGLKERSCLLLSEGLCDRRMYKKAKNIGSRPVIRTHDQSH